KMDTINWSAVARGAIERYVSDLEKFRELTKDSPITEEDALRMGRELKERIWRRTQHEFGDRLKRPIRGSDKRKQNSRGNLSSKS
ncbi:MAG: hypothetical protein ABIH34_00230, partial [Nanoarchaeota archaeon]